MEICARAGAARSQRGDDALLPCCCCARLSPLLIPPRRNYKNICHSHPFFHGAVCLFLSQPELFRPSFRSQSVGPFSLPSPSRSLTHPPRQRLTFQDIGNFTQNGHHKRRGSERGERRRSSVVLLLLWPRWLARSLALEGGTSLNFYLKS